MLNNWDDISVDLYKELVEIKKSESLTTTELYIEIIAFLEDVAPSDPIFDEMSSEELFKKIGNSSWIWALPEGRPKSWKNLSPKPLDDLTLGEFIELESYQTDPEDNLNKISALLWRKTKNDEWDNLRWEPYIYDISTRAEEFRSAPISYVYPILRVYEEWRQNFFIHYAELFMNDQDKQELEDIKEEEDKDQEGNFSRVGVKRQEILEKRQQKWSWESLIWSLVDGDVTKIIPLLELPVLLVFNMLSMKKSLEETGSTK